MAGEPGGVAASVRRKLAEGQSRDEIVAALVAGGLSKPSAERFVDREIGAQLPPLEPLVPAAPPALPVEAPASSDEPEPDPPVSGTLYEGPPPDQAADQIDQFFSTTVDDTAEADAKRDLRFGSYVTTIGIGLTLLSMVFPGGGVVFYGAVLYGVFRFIRGLVRYSKLDVPFPWARVAALAAIPILSFPVMFIAVSVWAVQLGSDQSMDRMMMIEEPTEPAPNMRRRRAGEASEIRQRRNADNVDVLAENLYRNGMQCDTARELSRTNSEQAVQHLIRYLQVTKNPNGAEQVCIVTALVDLGEIAPAIGHYRLWINGTNRYLWRAGVAGLGEIGPDAADEAIPLLKYLVESEIVEERLLAAQTLSRLGPAAEELLRVLADDVEQSVRYQASAGLKYLQ